MKAKQVTAFAVSCIATMIFSNATWAQITADVEKAAEQQDVPTAEQVIADYIEATGGEENHKAIKSIVSTGELLIDVQVQEITGEVSISQMAPNMALIKTTIDEVGEQSQGYNGKVGWVMSDMEGSQVLDGERLTMLQLQADINQYMNLGDYFSTVECTGEEEFNGEACYVVSASNEGGSPIVSYFSKESKYLVGSKMSMETPQGELELISHISDYRDVGNVKMSHKSETKNQFFTQTVTIESIEINPEMDKSVFDLPAEIKELVDDE